METEWLQSDSLVVSLLSFHGSLKLSIRDKAILVEIILLQERGARVNKSSKSNEKQAQNRLRHHFNELIVNFQKSRLLDELN